MGDLDGNLPTVAHIGGPKNGSHAAPRDKVLNPVLIELIACVQ
jgi:hypothetical protein